MANPGRNETLPSAYMRSSLAVYLRRSGQPLRVIGEHLGVSIVTAHRMSDPANRVKDRKGSRAWKAQHPGENRALGEARVRRGGQKTGSCDRCGNPIRPQYQTCRPCLSAAAREREAAVVALWNRDLSLIEISEAIGTTVGSISGVVGKLQKSGRISRRRSKRAA